MVSVHDSASFFFVGTFYYDHLSSSVLLSVLNVLLFPCRKENTKLPGRRPRSSSQPSPFGPLLSSASDFLIKFEHHQNLLRVCAQDLDQREKELITMTTNEEQPQGPSTGCGILGRYPILSVVAFVSTGLLRVVSFTNGQASHFCFRSRRLRTGGMWRWIGCWPLILGTR